MILSDEILGRKPNSWPKFLTGVILVPILFLALVSGFFAITELFYYQGILDSGSIFLEWKHEMTGEPRSIAAAFLVIGVIHLVLWPFIAIAYRRKYFSLVNPLKRLMRPDLAFGVVYVLALLIGSELLFYPFGRHIGEAHFVWQPEKWLIWFIPMAVIVFLQITAEELFFRGFMQQYLARLVPRRWVYIGIPSAIWAILHFGNFESNFQSGAVVLVIFVMGLVLGDWADVTGSLWGPICVHFVNNFALIMIYGNTFEPSDLNIVQYNSDAWSAGDFALYCAIGAVLMLVIYILMRKRIIAKAAAQL